MSSGWGPDFSFDGAPDPKVALGADGYDASTLMGALGANTGEQIYPPARGCRSGGLLRGLDLV